MTAIFDAISRLILNWTELKEAEVVVLEDLINDFKEQIAAKVPKHSFDRWLSAQDNTKEEYTETYENKYYVYHEYFQYIHSVLDHRNWHNKLADNTLWTEIMALEKIYNRRKEDEQNGRV